jgi:hypothetical protein
MNIPMMRMINRPFKTPVEWMMAMMFKNHPIANATTIHKPVNTPQFLAFIIYLPNKKYRNIKYAISPIKAIHIVNQMADCEI